MARCVIDASIAVKWFMDEPFSVDALRLRNDQAADLLQVDAPTLLPYEVLNAARFVGIFGEGELREIARTLDGFALSLHPLEGSLAQETASIALRTGLSVYDASYVALAKRLSVPLYSVDEEMLQAAGNLIEVAHVREYRTSVS